MTRAGSCSCGAVRVACAGAPLRVSVCHCRDCQRRSGSAFATQARFADDAVTITGETRRFERTGDSGNWFRSSFCPRCGSTIAYKTQAEPEVTAVPLGVFADPDAFALPAYSVYEERKARWVEITGAGIDHFD